MDAIDKALSKLTPKQRAELERLLQRIQDGHLTGLDLKKLVGKQHVYRVRKGDLRIIFERRGNAIRILALERRSSTTYRKRR